VKERDGVDLARFNAMDSAAVTEMLLACCDVPAWASAVSDGRPYADVDAVLAAADTAARDFTAADVDRALAAHPRIGERAVGESASARWSRGEQGRVDRDDSTLAALAAGNQAYEDRFGRVFLISAAGLSGSEILASLRGRLEHDDDTELGVVADELRKIALLRLRALLDEESEKEAAS
jgi:2-oxo-4-hydroxy-4-carboxy-5-ureidoimidazoline decarboxylase